MKKLACFLALALLFPAIAGAFPSWTAVGIGSHDVDWTLGGTGTLAVAGTFGGATVTFFWCAPLAGAAECFEVNAASCTFTARGTCDFFRGPGRLRLVVTGGTPSINAVAAGPTQATAGVGGSGGISGLLDGPVTYGDSAGSLTQAADFLYDEDQGFLGIGTASPATGLHVGEGAGLLVGPATFMQRTNLDALEISRNNDPLFSMRNLSAAGIGKSTGIIDLYAKDTGGDEDIVVRIRGTVTTLSATQLGGDLRFSTTPAGGSLTERVIIDENGNVTVSTTTAQLLLPSSSDAVTPTLGFGDGDMGFHEALDDELRLVIDATAILLCDADSVEIGAGLTFAPPPSATPPATCDGDTDGHLYDDTNQDLLCRCDGVTWAGVGGGATCT